MTEASCWVRLDPPELWKVYRRQIELLRKPAQHTQLWESPIVSYPFLPSFLFLLKLRIATFLLQELTNELFVIIPLPLLKSRVVNENLFVDSSVYPGTGFPRTKPAHGFVHQPDRPDQVVDKISVVRQRYHGPIPDTGCPENSEKIANPIEKPLPHAVWNRLELV